MSPSLITAIESLKHSYSGLYARLSGIDAQPISSLDNKAEQMRAILAHALYDEKPNTPKALAVYEIIKVLLTAYPKNRLEENDERTCPISFEKIDFDKPEQNFYSSISGYVYNKPSIKRWFLMRPQEIGDPINREPISPHEMNALCPNFQRIAHSFKPDSQRCGLGLLLISWIVYELIWGSRSHIIYGAFGMGEALAHETGLQQNPNVELRRRPVFLVGLLLLFTAIFTGDKVGYTGMLLVTGAVLFGLSKHPYLQSTATMRPLQFRNLEGQQALANPHQLPIPTTLTP